MRNTSTLYFTTINHTRKWIMTTQIVKQKLGTVKWNICNGLNNSWLECESFKIWRTSHTIEDGTNNGVRKSASRFRKRPCKAEFNGVRRVDKTPRCPFNSWQPTRANKARLPNDSEQLPLAVIDYDETGCVNSPEKTANFEKVDKTEKPWLRWLGKNRQI